MSGATGWFTNPARSGRTSSHSSSPSIRGVPEAGWALATWAQGNGYATEALAAALAWLDAQQRFERSVCLIAPTNVASIRVAEKAGYGAPQRIRFNDAESLMFSRKRR